MLDKQRQFFDTFGYLVLPGLVKNEIDWIIPEFEAVFTDRGVQHDGTKRTVVVPFIDQRERLCTLLDHPGILSAVSNLLGDDFNYLAGDGNYYTGDTGWHSDGYHEQGLYIKVAFYLDSVKKDTGCLRVIPGTHRTDMKSWHARNAGKSGDLWGVAQSEVPSIPLESEPGDVVIFNHNLMHAAFGGGARRRMFTMNLCAHCESTAEIEDLEDFINAQGRFWIDTLHSDIMRRTGPANRRRYLQQVIDHEGGLAAIAARARAERDEPSRG